MRRDSSLLESDTVSLGKYFAIFQRIIMPLSSVSSELLAQ